jgi:hypothetical protein
LDPQALYFNFCVTRVFWCNQGFLRHFKKLVMPTWSVMGRQWEYFSGLRVLSSLCGPEKDAGIGPKWKTNFASFKFLSWVVHSLWKEDEHFYFSSLYPFLYFMTQIQYSRVSLTLFPRLRGWPGHLMHNLFFKIYYKF